MSKKRKVSTEQFNSLEEICFPVRNIKNPMWANQDQSNLIVGLLPFEKGKNALKHLNTCSSRYKLIPNKEIFPVIEQMLMAQEIEYKRVYSHVNHVMFFVEYIITDERFAFTISGTNDKIYLRIKVQHSYNSKKVFRVSAGWFRLICSNGLVVPVKEMEQFNLILVVKHTEAIIENLKIFNQMLLTIVNDAPALIAANKAAFTSLAKIKVSEESFEDMLKETLEAAGINVVENTKFSTVNNIRERALKEANHPTLGYNGTINQWLVYNAINQFIHDDSINVKDPEQREIIDSKVLEHLLEQVS